jgi:UDP-N-acetylmuramate dehydrogenase
MNNLLKIRENINIYDDFNGKVKENEPLKAHSTFKIGGNARIFIEPFDQDALKATLSACAAFPYVIAGGGSNTLFPDGDFEKAVISLNALNGISHNEFDGRVIVRCGAGTSVEAVLDYCLWHNALGLERFAGLPGSVGGAVYMNARCYDATFCDFLDSVTLLDPKNLAFNEYRVRAGDWDYKKSPFMPGGTLAGCVITGAVFSLKKGSPDEAQKAKTDAAGFIEDRKRKGHFLFPSAGSVFKNNRAFAKPTGQLIDEAGLKGLAHGGAQIAPWHGNIIINKNNAASADVKVLIARAQHEVKKRFGFALEPEIVIY